MVISPVTLRRPAYAGTDTSPIVTIRSGRLSGTRGSNGTRVWRGIPYAQPPVGELRGRAPRASVSWTETRSATTFGSEAVQQGLGPIPAQVAGSEDCLYINVWAPEQPSEKARPVLVWIHGGGFVFGAGSEPIYDGEDYAARGDIVFVSFNYRLNGFGFLATSHQDGAANLGLLDQIAALRWVQDNIAAFGGDPANVTVMGESAGAMSIGCLLGAPMARGLFARAIIQSGGARPVFSQTDARKVTELALAKAGLQPDDDAKLMALPVEELKRIFKLMGDESNTALLGGEPFRPAIDGYVLPTHPLQNLAPVPTLIGHCENEGLTFAGVKNLLEGLPKRVRSLAGDARWEALTAAYAASARPQRDPMMDLFSDCFTGIPSLRLADGLAAVDAPVWSYRFDYQKASPIGAAHATDIAFTFGKAQGAPLPVEWTPEAQALSHHMRDSFIAFVRTGDPQTRDLPIWPRHDAKSLAYLRFDATPEISADYIGAARRQAWRDVPIEAV